MCRPECAPCVSYRAQLEAPCSGILWVCWAYGLYAGFLFLSGTADLQCGTGREEPNPSLLVGIMASLLIVSVEILILPNTYKCTHSHGCEHAPTCERPCSTPACISTLVCTYPPPRPHLNFTKTYWQDSSLPWLYSGSFLCGLCLLLPCPDAWS